MKKEIAGVDFIYGIELVSAGFFCCGCLFVDTDGECTVDECLACTAAGEDKAYALVEIPHKKPHVVGLAKIGAWLEKNGFHYSRASKLLVSGGPGINVIDPDLLMYYSGNPIKKQRAEELKFPKELIEYK